jgi:hypothetical protein
MTFDDDQEALAALAGFETRLANDSPLDVLGLTYTSTLEEAYDAYVVWALQVHPDRFRSEAATQRATVAIERLRGALYAFCEARTPTSRALMN